MKKSQLKEHLESETAIQHTAWQAMTNPVAIVLLVHHARPGSQSNQVAGWLESMLPKASFEEITFILNWAMEKHQYELVRKCLGEINAMIERIPDDSEEIPDFLVALSAPSCADKYGDDLLQKASAKIEAILGNVPAPAMTQTSFAISDRSEPWASQLCTTASAGQFDNGG